LSYEIIEDAKVKGFWHMHNYSSITV